MNGRQHLFLDALGQAGIILFFSFMIAKSEHPFEVLELMAILLFFWQLPNAFISVRFYERAAKATYTKVAGYSLIALAGFFGLLYFILQIWAGIIPFVDKVFFVIEQAIPYIFATFAIWYLGITVNELYNTIFNRI
jgi:hypothetical protein